MIITPKLIDTSMKAVDAEEIRKFNNENENPM